MSDQTIGIVMAGVGGQGILLASEIAARAAMAAGYDVKTNEVHGMAQRGGSVIAQVRYGRKVHSPLVGERTATAYAAFEKAEAIRYAHYLKPGGLAVVADFSIVPTTVSSGGGTYPDDIPERLAKLFPNLKFIDAVKIALELGNIRAANVVVMGALSTGLDLPLEAWQTAVHNAVKPQYRELNAKAFESGRQLVLAPA